jgi:hypothetical protein
MVIAGLAGDCVAMSVVASGFAKIGEAADLAGFATVCHGDGAFVLCSFNAIGESDVVAS